MTPWGAAAAARTSSASSLLSSLLLVLEVVVIDRNAFGSRWAKIEGFIVKFVSAKSESN